MSISERKLVLHQLRINLEKVGRWFGHLNRRPIEAPVRKIELLDFAHVQRGRGRPKKTGKKL
ncbi:hypothetical protein AXF42_Ash005821 [Apostasia shenzhenica]|uniref:Uncharacterized protein n=1 Tax=Apostasia shenzhenica TaxID=1088818 RepID=A0A2I0BCH2_9ASPA|nr:hypothetical protein AXF42_Ash005821 [Apostasia shenzhenica]